MGDDPRVTLAPGLEVTRSVRLVSPLGKGGMGSVWVAEHTGLKTRVVVKFMSPELAASESAVARFGQEAEAAAKVKSPHVVQMLDHG
jgi:serine/threonine-protein kinase